VRLCLVCDLLSDLLSDRLLDVDDLIQRTLQVIHLVHAVCLSVVSFPLVLRPTVRLARTSFLAGQIRSGWSLLNFLFTVEFHSAIESLRLDELVNVLSLFLVTQILVHVVRYPYRLDSTFFEIGQACNLLRLNGMLA
jgi:hypothetical protein